MSRVRWLLWTAVAVAGLAAFAAQRLAAPTRIEKGTFGTVPSFALTDQRGRTLTDRDLYGSPWVANFVFTRCASVCPLLTAKFKALQAQLGPLPGVHYVSISVDPAHDTPPVLATYAARFNADPERWHFLTGPLATIEQTVVRGFKIHIGEPQPSASDPSLIDIMHGEHFVLVDAGGTIRGYYRSDEDGLRELAADLRGLRAETRTAAAHQLVQ